MRLNKKKVFALALAVCLIATLSMGSLAWFTDSDQATNDFFVAGSENNNPDEVFSVDVWEDATPDDPDGEGKLDSIQFNKILPGDELYKEVHVENTGAYDQYVRVTVTVTDAHIWQALKGEMYVPLNKIVTGLNPAFELDRTVYNVEDDTLVYVMYYNAILPAEGVKDVELFTQVNIPKELTREQAAEMSGGFQIHVLADAVQTEHVGNNAKEAFITVGLADEEGKYVAVNTAAGLANLLKTGLLDSTTANDELTFGEELVNEAGSEVTLDLGDVVVEATINNDGKLDITGGTIDIPAWGMHNSGEATLTDVKVEAGSALDYSLVTEGTGAETVYNNVTIDSAGGGVGAVGGGTVEFNGGKLSVNTTSTSGRYLFYAEGAGSKIIINDGDFADFTKTSQNQKRAYVYAGEGTTVEINGGTFGKASTRDGYKEGIKGTGTVIIRGGTFGFDPSKWVATGYQAIYDSTAKTWTVQPKP